MINQFKTFFNQPFLKSERTLAIVWGAIALFSIYKMIHEGHPDADYLIFIHSICGKMCIISSSARSSQYISGDLSSNIVLY